LKVTAVAVAGVIICQTTSFATAVRKRFINYKITLTNDQLL